MLLTVKLCLFKSERETQRVSQLENNGQIMAQATTAEQNAIVTSLPFFCSLENHRDESKMHLQNNPYTCLLCEQRSTENQHLHLFVNVFESQSHNKVFAVTICKK